MQANSIQTKVKILDLAGWTGFESNVWPKSGSVLDVQRLLLREPNYCSWFTLFPLGVWFLLFVLKRETVQW